MKFWKMHGAGNDFVLINGLEEKSKNWNNLAKYLCDRHFGIGADGLEYCEKSLIADIKMHYYNSDGSKGEMCGNGIRCFSKFVYENKIVNKTEFSVETDAGIKYITLILDDAEKVKYVSVNMGKGNFSAKSIPCTIDKKCILNESINIGKKNIEISSMLMSVPHTTVFVDEIDDYPVNEVGSLIEKSTSIFPQKTNVNFAYVKDENTIIIKTWERGAGRTLACGTGCCATGVLAHKLGKTKNNKIRLITEGGEVFVQFDNDYNVIMTGEAIKVFQGEINL
ncbi:diaminopimelate epimerase [Fusobacterium sp. PH5-44]|uniref:diaminopimelate epimerase n=1 Tax=unclassified Fusobacterium TaxID=2648384 RepID=UPI003D1FF280